MWMKTYQTYKSMNLPLEFKVSGKLKKRNKENKIVEIQEEINILQNRRLGINPELENWETTGKIEGVNWV